MKYLTLLVVVLFSGVAVADKHAGKNPIQDTKAAEKFFQDELDFTAGPSTVRKVTQKKLDGVIVDLRKKEHFDAGHIPGAINLPFDKFKGFSDSHKDFPGLSKDKINYVYCYETLCNLSQKAARKFASLGYPVKELRGGFQGWKDHSFDIEKSEGK